MSLDAIQEGWFSKSELLRLSDLLDQAKDGGWEWLIRTRSDYTALLQGHTFDIAKAKHAEQFFTSFLKLPGGRRFELLDWQKYGIIWPLFGWMQPNGTRRFQRCFVEIAKKNGKSQLVSGLLLYLLVADGEEKPQVFTAAVDRKQAGIVFDECHRMVKQSPLLSSRLRSLPSTKRITYQERFGFLQALSADSATAEGIDASGVIIDELHLHKDRKLYDILRFSGLARKQPLMVIITTAGNNPDSVCFEEFSYSKKLLAGDHVDIAVLPVIYEASPEDDIDDPATWYKANPSLGVVLSVDDFKRDLEEAKTSPARMTNFKQRRLNIWANKNESAGFLTPQQWLACAGEFPSEEELAKLPLYVGIDLGRSDDFSALASVWKDTDKYYVRVALWNPEETIAAKALLGRWPYREWTDAGWIAACDGATVDIEDIQGELARLVQTYQVREIAYDGYTAGDMIKKWDIEGYTTVQVPQKIMNLSAPTKEFERLILAKELIHDGNPVLAWMISNVFIISDASGNIRIDKKRSAEKIDGIAAIINALSRAMLSIEEDTPYQGCGFVVI